MDLKKLMQQAQDMQNKMLNAQNELASKEFEGKSGGNMVVVKMNGKGEALSIKIDPSILNPNDQEMLEDLLVAALNDAKAHLDDNSKNSMGNIFSDSGIKFPF